jgi:hypothetical protein
MIAGTPGLAQLGAGPTMPTGWHWLKPLERVRQNWLTE